MPFSQAHKTNQYFVSNYSYYWEVTLTAGQIRGMNMDILPVFC